MSPENANVAAEAILSKRPDQSRITVLVDNPNDCHQTVVAFKRLGCRVKVEADGARLIVTRSSR